MATQLKPHKLFMIGWIVATVVTTAGWLFLLVDMTWSVVDVLFQ